MGEPMSPVGRALKAQNPCRELPIDLIAEKGLFRYGDSAVGYAHDLKTDIPQQLFGSFGNFVVVLDKQDTERRHNLGFRQAACLAG